MSDPPNITSDGDGLVAEFPITYALTNSKGTSSGTLRMTMHHKPQAQTWQVAGIQKEVIQATMKQRECPSSYLRRTSTRAISKNGE